MFAAVRKMWMCWGIIAVLAPLAWGAVTIDKVLPFTPTADSIRIQVTASGEAGGSTLVQLAGSIAPSGSARPIWTGPLGPAHFAPNAPAVVEKLVEKLKVDPWSPGSPRLYDLKVTATQGGRQVATQTVRFGFRHVESRNGQVYLNGKPIFLRGLAINPPGRTVPKEVGESRQFAYDYVKYLRGQNLNLIRLNEASQDWFDVCDELGMMLYQGFYGSPPTGLSDAEKELQKVLEAQDEAEGKRLPRDVPRSLAAYQAEFETYVRHPSIIMYILTNEMPYRGQAGEEVHEFLTHAYEQLSKWDHTRLYIGNAGYGEGRQGDINDVHRYWGWYYNTFATYYNLRDPKLFGEFEKNQPFTFSECVGNFTGPNGAYNCIERKQLAAAMTWTGTAADQPKEAQSYQAFMTKQACELFRRMRSSNNRLSGLMPFTITFHNWQGITSFSQMKPTAAAVQFGVSYQPVLLSWELWQTQVRSSATIAPIVHVVNDADDFSDLAGASLSWELRGAGTRPALTGKLAVPTVPYYGTWKNRLSIALPKELPSGEYRLVGRIDRGGRTVSTNEQPIFIAGADWQKPPAATKRRVLVYDDPSGSTSKALKAVGISATGAADIGRLDPQRDCLVIGQQAWDKQLTAGAKTLAGFVKAGGRVLCLGQNHAGFNTSWVPAKIEMCKTTVNAPEYMTADRPMADGMHINPQRPDHPALAGVDRQRLKMWSDPTDWDESKRGFPSVYPVEFGFRLTDTDDLSRAAILADYDQGLAGVALCEMFDGDGSVMLTGFEMVRRVGVDPVAERMLSNLVAYMAGDQPRARYPLVKSPIRWGDYSTHAGTLSGPIHGLFINADWVPPPIAPNAKPLTDAEGAWNTKPSDQFVPNGIRPRGAFYYTFNCGVRDVEKESKAGAGIFFATLPAGRRTVVTKVRNPTTQPAALRVDVNDAAGKPVEVPTEKSVIIRTPIPQQATEVGVRYSGEKELIIEETSFQ